jgi:hypothetical protein
MDDDTLPAPIIEDGLEHDFEIMGGDMWEVADGRETYSEYFKDFHRRM